jgi:hypothetical protein
LAKVATKSVSGSSKGMAGFAALVNSANFSAARNETNHGLASGSSSGATRSGVKSKSKSAKKVLTFLLFTF